MATYADASPLIGLARIGRLDLLDVLPPPIHVTSNVWGEVTGNPQKPGVEALRQAEAAGTITVVARGDATDYPFLGTGEAQTLSAARATQGAVVVDDAEARRLLRSDPALVGAIPACITTVELVLLAKRRGRLMQARATLDALIAEKLYIHPALYEAALHAAGEWPPPQAPPDTTA